MEFGLESQLQVKIYRKGLSPSFGLVPFYFTRLNDLMDLCPFYSANNII